MKTAAQVRKERKADEFNRLVVGGMSQVEAWTKLNPRKRGLAYDSRCAMASQFGNSVFVKARLRIYLDSAKIADLDSEGRAHSDILEVMGLAKAENNLTAYAALARIRSQHIGLLKESVNITQSNVTDDEIIKRLAGDDPQLQARIRRQLGKAGFDAAPANDSADPDDANVVALRKSK